MADRYHISDLANTLPATTFPAERDLLVTTCSAVSRWSSSTGINKIYRSVHDSVATSRWSDAALAVADGRVVLLDDSGTTKRRYRLKTGEGHLFVLACANNQKELLFSTSVQHAIQRYCIAEDRLLDWKCMHPSPPTTLAVSARSKYAISSSQNPPATYLSLLDNATHILFWPHASKAAITAAAFHPITEEHFILGYADGTVSVHTASRIVLMQTTGSDGSIGHLKRAHRTTNERIHRRPVPHRATTGSDEVQGKVGPRNVGITASAFLSGCKLRLITIAGDGKCRMIDFERGAQVLRTWSVDAPCTSLAIYSRAGRRNGSDYSIPSHTIAIGTADGRVCLFDYLGLLQEERLIDNARRKIIALEWVPPKLTQGQPARSATLDGKAQPSVSSPDWKFSSQIAPTLDNDRTKTPVALRRVASRSASDSGLWETAAGENPALQPITPTFPTSNQATGERMWPQSPSSSAKRKGMLEAKSQVTQTPPNLLHFLRKHAHAQSAPVAHVIDSPLPEREGARSTGRHPRLSSEQRTRMQSPSAEHLARRHTIAATGASTLTASYQYTARPAGRNRRDSAMPCSWVSESGSTSSSEEVQGPIETQTASPNRNVNLVQLTAPDLPKARIRPKADLPTPSRGRLQTLPALSASTISLADLSDGWDTDAESSPARSLRSNKTKHKGPARRLRRMTIHDNLARFQLDFDRNPRDRSPSEYSPWQNIPATNPAIPQKRSEPLSSLSSVYPGEPHDRISGEDDGRQIPSAASRTSELLPLYTCHHQDEDTIADKPLPRPPMNEEPSSDEELACKCDCADTVREEMALVRAELASLRKALWVFGSRVEASGWRDVAAGDVPQGPTASDDAFVGFDAVGGRWDEEESRGRTRRRSSS